MNLQPKPPIVILVLLVTPTHTSDILLLVLLKCDSHYTAGIMGIVNFYDCYSNVLCTDIHMNFGYWRPLSLHSCESSVPKLRPLYYFYGSLISSLPAVQIMRHARHVGNIISIVM